MPLTAQHSTHGLLDTTMDDLGNVAVIWDDIHAVRPRPTLTCPVCSVGMHAKESSRGLRFFAHDPRQSGECPLRGESVEHRELKNEIARAARHLGWNATVEASGHGWRADVLATDPASSRSLVWEVQLSKASPEDIASRTAAYVDAGHEICWVTTKRNADWVATVPSIVLEPGRVSGWVVVDGHRQPAERPLMGLQAVDSWNLTNDAHQLRGQRSLSWLARFGSQPPWWDWGRLLAISDHGGPPDSGADVQRREVPRAQHFRARMTWWRGRRCGLFTFVGAIQSGEIVPVELSAPHFDSTVRRSSVVWTSWEHVHRALDYTAFAAGWPVTATTCPPDCPDCSCECGSGSHFVIVAEGHKRHGCEFCDEDLFDLASGVYSWERDYIHNGDETAPTALDFEHPLIYQR